MSTKQFILSARNPVAAVGYVLMAYAMTAAVYAGTAGGSVKAETSGQAVVSNFINNIAGILNAASIVVVTIAIVFSGYQIAFNNKRISDVAPVLLGGVLIGGAAQLANMLVSTGTIGKAATGGT